MTDRDSAVPGVGADEPAELTPEQFLELATALTKATRWLALVGGQVRMLRLMAASDDVLEAELPRPKTYASRTDMTYNVAVAPHLWDRVCRLLDAFGFAVLAVPNARVQPDTGDDTAPPAGPLYLAVSRHQLTASQVQEPEA